MACTRHLPGQQAALCQLLDYPPAPRPATRSPSGVICPFCEQTPTADGWIGRWKVEGGKVTLSLCSAKYVLEFRNVLGGSGGNWGFSATKEGSGQALPDGQLNDKSQQVDAMLPDSQACGGK